MSDVLLINPRYDRRVLRECPSFPLGLAYIGAVLERSDFSVAAIDCDFDNQDVIRVLKKESPRIVGLSVMSSCLRESYRLIRYLKKTLPETVVVAGGPHVTSDPVSVRQIGADYGIVGYGEFGFDALCKKILSGSDVLDVGGLVYMENNNVRVNPITEFDVNELPTPARHLFKARYRFNSVVLSRGCPFNCIFCSLAKTGYKCRTPDDVFDEVSALVKGGVKKIDFVDDVFTLNQDIVMELCGLIGKLGVEWACTTRVDLVNRALLERMYEAGCRNVSFGVETGVERIRYLIGKEIPDKRYFEVFGFCRDRGIKTRAYAMFGHPTETIGDMEKTITFVKRLRPDYATFRITDIVPGSGLFNRAIKEGLVRESVWQGYMLDRRSYPVYVPEGVSLGDMYYTYRRAYENFYFDFGYIGYKFKNVTTLNDIKEIIKLGYFLLKPGGLM